MVKMKLHNRERETDGKTNSTNSNSSPNRDSRIPGFYILFKNSSPGFNKSAHTLAMTEAEPTSLDITRMAKLMFIRLYVFRMYNW
jgi:hypothetical protein